MSALKSSLSEDEPLRTNADEDEIRAIWDRILDILLERTHRKSIAIAELAHVIEELSLLFRAVKGRNGAWASVIEVSLFLLKRDATVSDLKASLPFNESTLYRALSRLELAGFAAHMEGRDLGRVWTINKEKCPVLYRASRPS